MASICACWVCLGWFVALSFAGFAQDAQLGKPTIESYKFRTYDGKEHDADLGRLWVRAEIRSKLLALFVSGTLDGTTPASQAEELQRGFPHSTHLLIENGGHETLPNSEVQAVVVEFLRGQDVSKRSVKFERPKFSPLETTPAGQR